MFVHFVHFATVGVEVVVVEAVGAAAAGLDHYHDGSNNLAHTVAVRKTNTESLVLWSCNPYRNRGREMCRGDVDGSASNCNGCTGV